MDDKRILLVEDDPEVRDLLELALRSEGYLVDVAATAIEGQRYLRSSSYALVVTDWKLPDGDGTTIADWAAQLGARTFIMSGYLFMMPGGRSLEHETLMKPVRPSELVAAVEQAIGKAKTP